MTSDLARDVRAALVPTQHFLPRYSSEPLAYCGAPFIPQADPVNACAECMRQWQAENPLVKPMPHWVVREP